MFKQDLMNISSFMDNINIHVVLYYRGRRNLGPRPPKNGRDRKIHVRPRNVEISGFSFKMEVDFIQILNENSRSRGYIEKVENRENGDFECSRT
jgi:hypothetical protein